MSDYADKARSLGFAPRMRERAKSNASRSTVTPFEDGTGKAKVTERWDGSNDTAVKPATLEVVLAGKDKERVFGREAARIKERVRDQGT